MVLPCMAQTKTDDDVVRITTNLVQVDIVVTKNGKAVRDLIRVEHRCRQAATA